MILTFYMKSGNTIRIDGVAAYTIKQSADDPDAIVSLNLTQRNNQRTSLLVKTIALSQIEAITREYDARDWRIARWNAIKERVANFFNLFS